MVLCDIRTRSNSLTDRKRRTSRYDSLPDENTDEGAMARLLIVEVGPQQGDLSTLVEAMGLMKIIIDNRLANNPADFMAPNATREIDIIRAERKDGRAVQYAGFPSYPVISPGQKDELDKTLDASLDPASPYYEQSSRLVRAAVAIAKAPTPPDPSTYGLYFWRTANHPLGLKDYKFYRNVAGIDFYQKAPPKLKVKENSQSPARGPLQYHHGRPKTPQSSTVGSLNGPMIYPHKRPGPR